VRNTRSRQTPAVLHYRDFDEARASERRESLTQSIATHEPRYSPLTLSSALGLPFKPRVVATDYLKWPRVPELFPESFPGVQSGRDDLVTDISSENLEKRIRNYLNPQFSHAEMDALVPGTMIDTNRFRATEVRVALQTRGFRPWQILPFAYRPYDNRWLYWEPTTKLLDEKREEYVRQYRTDVPVMYLAQKNRKAFDPPGTTYLIANRHLNERGANVFPLSTMGEPLPGHVESRTNVSEGAARYLSELKIENSSLFFHSLAIMHTPQYRTENSGALMSDWPRIPLPATADLLAHSAALGRRLAELLDAESSIRLTGEWSFLAALKLPKNSDLENALKLTAGWGYRGQGSTVMPGQGLSPERQWSAVEREKLAALATAQSLTLEDALALLGESCVDSHLTGESFWPAIPINVWNYTLGGYQVLKKWLSYREFPLLGRPLHSEEAAYVAQVVRRIAAILLLGPALDASYLAILPTATVLPTV